ncbi:MAG: adenylate/guanylate cyclase domain-containing protein [Opitutae bacterium]|nr:adenylate/guanylate cyclase domain-containing protein [Opitutae bacterium]
MSVHGHGSPHILRRQVVLGALAAALFFALPWTWLEHWEGDAVDFRLRLRGVRTDATPVVLIGVDDSSFTIAERAPGEAAREPLLAAMGGNWPWDRRVFAAVVQKLAESGARAVVFDFVFARETPGDAEFAAALAKAGRPVVLAKQYTQAETLEGERSVSLLEPQERFVRAQPWVRTGYANIWPDDDGVVRTARPALAAGELLGDPAAGGSRDPSLALAVAQTVGAVQPPGEAGLIDFRGPAGVFPMVPVENLFLPDRWAGAVIDRGRLFKDRIVLVGPWSEVRFKDYHATPFGRMTGAELQANLIASLLGRGLLKSVPGAAIPAAVLLAAVLAGWICLRATRVRVQLAGLGVALLAWLALAQIALVTAGWLVPVAAPVGALLAAGAVGVGVRYAGEQRERRRLRSLLSSYVSEKVADIIVHQPESLAASFQGERRPVTVLFSDLRGFTRLTEERPPESLVAQLNEYLRAMVDCILAEDGTVEKYIGDAILAVWGDTHTHGEAEDAGKAVAAALAMEAALARLNREWAGRPDRVQLRMGIGLHQGIVTVGNLGHPRRMEFGVLGDAVNTASRLEGATKYLGAALLAGEPVARLAAARYRFLPVGRLRVAGRAGSMEVFAPFDPAGMPAPAWIAGYGQALAQLQAGAFAAAAEAFRVLPRDEPRLQALLDFQTQRAAALAANPPASWDGVLHLEEK